MPTCRAIRGWLVAAAVSLTAAPALAFEPTAEIATPNDAYRFGMDAYHAGDLATALDAFQYASEHGHVRAKWMVGRMYSRGEGAEQDDDRAFEIFADIAAENDDRRLSPDAPFVADAFVALGDYYRNTDEAGGVDPEAALEMYWDAATYFNDPVAQYNLAVMFYRGETGDADPAEAARWAFRAAQAGSPEAQALLGYLLFQGEGVTRQPVLGLAYLHLALMSDSLNAEVRRLHEQVMAQATETERRTALELANSWMVAEQATPDTTTAAAAVAASPAAAAGAPQ